MSYRDFTLKIFLFTIILMTCNVILAFGTAFAYYSEVTMYLDKYKAVKTIQSPKIVFVGGSSNMLGLSIAQLEPQVAPYEVVNMGMPINVGLAMMLNQVVDHIHEDDIVVLSLEYANYYILPYGNTTMLYQLISLDPSLVSDIQYWKQWKTILTGYPQQVRQNIYTLMIDDNRIERILRNCPDCDRKVDENGDWLFDTPRPTIFRNSGVKSSRIHPDVLTLINEFQTTVEARGAHVVITFPPYPIEIYEQEVDIINSLYTKLTEQTTIPILGTPIDYTLPIDLFWDSTYHVSDDGRVVHTYNIQQQMQQFMSDLAQ